MSTKSMRPPFLEILLRISSSEVAPLTLKSDLDRSMAMPREHFGRRTGAPDEKYPEVQKPHDAIFRE